ncbi:hypothetical protein HZB78_03905 [Candidatus Collierbacteria bacterium]|nr:hypothetical protein [Candidatus Collierbacteria bacterium]
MPRKFPRQEALIVLSLNQKQLLAEILGNIAVAWFTVGVISPIFLGIFSLTTAFSISAAIISTLLFIVAALMIIKERDLK